jgi:hypothetical protein
MIKKINGKYVVLSETTGRRFGTYDTRAEAERRLRQIEFFKHLRARSGRRRATAARVAVLAVLAIVAWAIPAWSAGREARYSGTVIAVDRAAGTIVVEGMGPWRVKDGVTQLERRTISVAPSAEFVRLKRASGVAPSGWTGDFIESPLPAWQVKAGDWVTVSLQPDAKRPTAIRIDVGEPGEL